MCKGFYFSHRERGICCVLRNICLNFVLEKMQLLCQFTEEHLNVTILNAKQFSIHGGDKAFFVIRSLVPFHLVLLKHKNNGDE